MAKINILVNLIIVYTLNNHILSVNCNNIIQLKTLLVYDPVVLDCCSVLGEMNSWKFNDTNMLYLNTIVVDEWFRRSTELVGNYSLLFHSVHLFHEGMYECLRDSVVVSKYYVNVNGKSSFSCSFYFHVIIHYTVKNVVNPAHLKYSSYVSICIFTAFLDIHVSTNEMKNNLSNNYNKNNNK